MNNMRMRLISENRLSELLHEATKGKHGVSKVWMDVVFTSLPSVDLIIEVCVALIDKPFTFDEVGGTIFCIHCKAIQGKTQKQHLDSCIVNTAKHILSICKEGE